MINPVNIVKFFADRVSNSLFFTLSDTLTTTTVTNRECEVAKMLCNVLESITDSHLHSLEIETTFDHELVTAELIYDVEYEDEAEVEDTFDPNWNSDEDDEEKKLCKEFSLEYINKTVNFYDKINPKTEKRKQQWKTVKHHFQRIPHQNSLTQFRHYFEKQGTKKQKLDKINGLVFDMFERARRKGLSVHCINLRRWTFKKAMDECL